MQCKPPWNFPWSAGVDRANCVGVEKREAAEVGVVAGTGFFGYRYFLVRAHQCDGAGRAVSDSGDANRQISP